MNDSVEEERNLLHCVELCLLLLFFGMSVELRFQK